MQESLEQLITRVVKDLEQDKIDKRVDNYRDLKSKYVNLKPRVAVHVELTNGKSLEIDVTDYFKGVIK